MLLLLLLLFETSSMLGDRKQFDLINIAAKPEVTLKLESSFMASYDEDQAIWFESQWGFGFGRQRDNEATFLQLLFSESPALLCWLQNVQTHKRTLLNALLHFTSWHLNTFCDQFWGIWWFLVQHQLPVVCGGSQGWVGLWSIGHSGCHCRYHHRKPTSFWFCDIPFHLTYKIGWSSVFTSSHIFIYISANCLLPYTSWFYSNCHLLLSSRPDVVALDPWSGHFRLKYSTPRLSWWWGGWAIDFEENVNVFSTGFFSSSWGCEEISHLRADFQNAR